MGIKEYSCINAVQNRTIRFYLGISKYTPNNAVFVCQWFCVFHATLYFAQSVPGECQYGPFQKQRWELKATHTYFNYSPKQVHIFRKLTAKGCRSLLTIEKRNVVLPIPDEILLYITTKDAQSYNRYFNHF